MTTAQHSTATASRPTAVGDIHLTTGWEPDLDHTDSLLRRFVFHYAESLLAPATVSGGRVLRTDDVLIGERGPGAALYNSSVLVRPPLERLDQVLDEVEDYVDAGTGETWLWSPWPMRDISRRGWTLEGHPPFLIRPAGPVPHRPAPGEITEVTDAASLATFERIVIEGFPLTSMLPHRPGMPFDPAILDDDRYTFLVGWLDGNPVAAGASFVADGISSLALGVTMPSARRRGMWDALARARISLEPGLVTTGTFSDMSRPGAEARFGFLPITRFTLWRREPTTRRTA